MEQKNVICFSISKDAMDHQLEWCFKTARTDWADVKIFV